MFQRGYGLTGLQLPDFRSVVEMVVDIPVAFFFAVGEVSHFWWQPSNFFQLILFAQNTSTWFCLKIELNGPSSSSLWTCCFLVVYIYIHRLQTPEIIWIWTNNMDEYWEVRHIPHGISSYYIHISPGNMGTLNSIVLFIPSLSSSWRTPHDWFKGQFTGKPHDLHGKSLVSGEDFPSQSIELPTPTHDFQPCARAWEPPCHPP